MSQGAEHVSTAFWNRGLYSWLLNIYHVLVEKGFDFNSDSTHALKSFLHTLYNNACHGLSEDNYNFFYSLAHNIFVNVHLER
jgi:hypothetical protein